MERRKRINEFYHFLVKNRKAESDYNTILKRLMVEIDAEHESRDDDFKKDYYDSLLQIKAGQMIKYVESKLNGTDQEVQAEFERFVSFLIQDVKLHGLGVAQ